MPFTIVIEPDALTDIQQAIDFYDDQQIGLGAKFEAAINRHFSSLKDYPFFQVRYDDVHCLPVKKYPYMIHFTIDSRDQIISVRAVLHTSRNPDNWGSRK